MVQFSEDDVTGIIAGGADALGLATRSANMTVYDLQRCYVALRTAADTYREEKDGTEQVKVERIARETLDRHLEFQAAFTVLGIRGISVEVAQGVPPSERRTQYLQFLYGAPNDFAFFDDR